MSMYQKADESMNDLLYPDRLFKTTVRQGRSERDAEAYFSVR
jgi:hypothetical protein